MKTLENLFEDLGVLVDEYLYRDDKAFISTVLYLLSNDEKKYNQLIEIAEPNLKEIAYSIIGSKDRGHIVHDNDKFMWLLRYGFCNGDETKTKRMFEIITGKVIIEINEN